MLIKFRDDKTFASAAEMRAHYAAIRARLNPRPPPVPRPQPKIDKIGPPAPLPSAIKPPSTRSIEYARRRERIRGIVAQFHLLKDDTERIVNAAAAYFGVEIAELAGKKRKPPICDARFVAIYLMAELYEQLPLKRARTDRGWSWIAPRFNRDHTSIMHAVNCVHKSKRLLAEANMVRRIVVGHITGVPYVKGEGFIRVDPEAYTLKRSDIAARL